MFNPVYTPFSVSEAASILEINIEHCLDLRRRGKLRASLKHDMRPALSVSHHSAVDLVEFTAFSSLTRIEEDLPFVLEAVEACMDFLCEEEWVQDWEGIQPEAFYAENVDLLSNYLSNRCASFERIQWSLVKHALPSFEDLVLSHWFTILRRCCSLLQPQTVTS